MFVNEFTLFSLTFLSLIDIMTLEVLEMNTRIRELRKALDLSQKEFADKIGLKQNAISYMERGGSAVTEQNIKLRTGTGHMFIENDRKQKEFFAIFDELSPDLQDHLIRTAKDLLETQAKMDNRKSEKSKIQSRN